MVIPALIRLSLLLLVTSAFAQLPDAPQLQKTFWSLTGAYSGAIIADDISTQHYETLGCSELNSFLYSEHPSNFRLLSVSFGIQLAAEIPAYYAVRSRKRFWKVVGYSSLLAQTGIRTDAVILNYKTTRAGCKRTVWHQVQQ